MNLGGWIMFLLSWAAILALAGYCFRQVFRKKVNE